MHSYVILLLVAVLTVSVAAFCVMGVRQRRRRRVLKEAAAEMKLAFSAADMDDLPLRYSDLTLIGSGHSRRADNIASGRVGHWRVRVFDFRYEVGHGVRRLTRYYSAAIAELAGPLESVLMWHRRDMANAPLQARDADGTAGNWVYLGSEATAHKLAHACAPLAELAVSMQVQRDVLLLCCPARQPHAYTRLMASLAGVLAILTGHTAIGAKGAKGASASAGDTNRKSGNEAVEKQSAE